MAIPQFTLRQMVEAGVHFGHHARRWNPQMAPYIYGKKDNIHIIDLQKTYPMLYTALAAARDIAAQGGKVLFVGTKRQAQDIVKENAERCGQYYVNHRWLGGMLTNWKTVYKSISRLVKLNEMEEKNAYEGYTKKEMLNLKKEREKLASELSGIMNMGGQPDLLFVIDTPKEALAVKEAKKLGIPVIGITDTNANPNDVDFPVPGNDDAIRAISSIGLAHLGDAVYELLVRTYLCVHGKATGKGLHRATVELVCAPQQARFAEKLLPLLTEEEASVFRRGRNANVHSIPHHADRADYQKATGLEALFGWLYLRDDHARINELFNRMMEDDNAT